MDEQDGASIEKNERTVLTDAKPQTQDVEEATRYENEATSARDSNDKSSDNINKSEVSNKKEVPEMCTNSSGTSVDKNTTYCSVTDLELQLAEETSRLDKAHGTTSMMDDASELNNTSEISEYKDVTDGDVTAASDSAVQPRINKLIRLDEKLPDATDKPDASENKLKYWNIFKAHYKKTKTVLRKYSSKRTNQKRKKADQQHPTSRETQIALREDDRDQESNKRIVGAASQSIELESEKNIVDIIRSERLSIDINTTTSDIQPITYDKNQLNDNFQRHTDASNQLHEDNDLPNTKITKITKQYVNPQLTEEASQYENAHGTTSTMDADDEASELINKSAVSECKEGIDVVTEERELAEPTAANDSVVQNRNAANSTVGNAQLAHQSARPPNPSVVEYSTIGSDAEPDEKIQEVGSPDLAAAIAAAPHQSSICSGEKQNDENTRECRSTSHEEESEQRNTDEASNSQCGTVVPNDTPHLIDKFKDMKLQTEISDTYKKFFPEEIGKKPKIDQTYNVKNEPIILDRIKNITKQSIVECDSEETMAQVKKLIEKMINTQLRELEELEFGQCHLEKEHLEEFLLKEVLKAVVCKILKLSIGYTKNVTDLIPSYCRIASNYKSTKLSLIFNDLKNEDIEALLENLDENEEYEEIDMSYNKNIGPVGYENIGKMVKKHGVRAVRLADCDISDVDLHKLFDGMGDAKLEELDISCTNNVTAEGFAHIGKQVAQKRIKRLKLSDTQLNFDTLSAFYEGVKGLIKDSEGQQGLLEEIDVSYNSAMESEAYKVLGSMVKLFGVKKLSLAGCGLKKEHLQNLRKKMNSENPLENTGQYTKMKSLNAGDNTSIGEGIVEIAKIVKECLLEELDISECRLSVNELKDFIKALGNAKLERLYLGEERQFDKYYISQVCNLLPHIKKMVRLKGTVRNNPRRLLQDKLNKLGESELEIKLDDERTLCAQINDEVPLSNSS